jgi:hypothetical protein
MSIVNIINGSILAPHLKSGIQAIQRKYRNKICNGTPLNSVDIDTTQQRNQPNANRWDYLIVATKSNTQIAVFVEIHSAYSCEVGTVIKKYDWLRNFISTNLRNLQLGSAKYFWISSDGIHIPKHTPQYKRLARHPFLRLQTNLDLSKI